MVYLIYFWKVCAFAVLILICTIAIKQVVVKRIGMHSIKTIGMIFVKVNLCLCLKEEF